MANQSKNILSVLHRLVTNELGENYWFNACASYVMECLGEKDYDYEFFAGLTGDVFVQFYTHGKYLGDGVSGYNLAEYSDMYAEEGKLLQPHTGAVAFVEETFRKCGYASTFVPAAELRKNRWMYVRTLMAYIDTGIPVISWDFGKAVEGHCGVYVGYDDSGHTLLFITDNSGESVRIPLEEAFMAGGAEGFGGWIFVGEKQEERKLSELYREAIYQLPKLFTTKTEKFCFGPQAFREWAGDLDRGCFDGMREEDFEPWTHYTNYICGLATNGSCCHGFLKRAKELNPDMEYLDEVSRLYRRMADMWNNDDGQDLESIGGGFNITLSVLKNKTKRDKIVAKLYEFADVADEVLELLCRRICDESIDG